MLPPGEIARPVEGEWEVGSGPGRRLGQIGESSQDRVEGAHQLTGVVRLLHESDPADRAGAPSAFRTNIAGEEDHRDAPGRGGALEQFTDLIAAHAGEQDVEQDDVGSLGAGQLKTGMVCSVTYYGKGGLIYSAACKG